jgi:hypothetical protein
LNERQALEIVARFVASLERHSSFDGTGTGTAGQGHEAPGVLLWAVFFQAHMLHRCGDVQVPLANHY